MPLALRNSRTSRRLLLAAMPAAILAPLLPIASVHAEPCCGSITPDGERLLARLNASGVDHLWLPHQHIRWETGELDNDPYGRPAATHCSAFVAAFQARGRVESGSSNTRSTDSGATSEPVSEIMVGYVAAASLGRDDRPPE